MLRYALMNKNKVVAICEEKEAYGEYSYSIVERIDEYLPYGFTTLNEWIDDRQIAKHRASIKQLMRELGIDDRHGFIDMVRCVSLTDTFWMKREDSSLAWEDVSLSDIRSKLVALKDFEYEDPGFGYPAWKLEVANRIKTQMIDAILA